MTDGDNLQWMQRTFVSTSNDWYGSSLRGQFPVGWTISPAVLELLPTVAKYIFDNATPNDDFIAAPSGIGYILPSYYHQGTYPDLSLFCNLTAEYMDRLNFSIVNIIDDSYDATALETYSIPDQVKSVFLYLVRNLLFFRFLTILNIY